MNPTVHLQENKIIESYINDHLQGEKNNPFTSSQEDQMFKEIPETIYLRFGRC